MFKLKNLFSKFETLSNIKNHYSLSSLSFDSYYELLQLIDRFGCYDIRYDKDVDKFEKISDVKLKDFGGEHIFWNMIRKLDGKDKAKFIFEIIKIYYKYKCQDLYDLLEDYMNNEKVLNDLYFVTNKKDKKFLLKAIYDFVFLDSKTLPIILQIIVDIPNDKYVELILYKIKSSFEKEKLYSDDLYLIYNVIIFNQRKNISKKLTKFLETLDEKILSRLIFEIAFFYKKNEIKLIKKILNGFIKVGQYLNDYVYDYLNTKIQFDDEHIEEVFGIICNDERFSDFWNEIKEHIGDELKSILKNAKCFKIIDMLEIFEI